jgi:predicted Rossmann fold flavoprotein
MSGGGRCNFTNLHVAPDRFQSANPHFCKSALSRYTQWDFIELVERHGIDYFEKETVNGLSGQLFCRQSSKQIVAMLLDECDRSGVEVSLDCETGAVAGPGPFRLTTPGGELCSETLVVATGGLSIPSLGGSSFGYRLAEQFEIEVLPTSAGLAPFTFSGSLKERFSRIAGVSCEVIAGTHGAAFREDLLFTHRGLSGPVILQLSSHWQPGQGISLNLAPGTALGEELVRAKHEHPRSLLRTRLDSLLPHRLVHEIEDLFWSGMADRQLGDWPDRQLEALGNSLQNWTIKPSGTEGYRKAEVTLGGVDTRYLSSKTMESGVPGLFFVGEVVDVTGELGGFNFQWAWSSGHAAGQAV